MPDTIVSIMEKTRACSCTLSVLANIFWAQNSQNDNYKNSGFNANCPKPKMTPFSLTLFLYCFQQTQHLQLKRCISKKTLFFSCFCLFFVGGLTGEVRWPEGPPHLALNPPCFSFFLFCFLFSFCFWFFLEGLRVKCIFFSCRFFFCFCFGVLLFFDFGYQPKTSLEQLEIRKPQ